MLGFRGHFASKSRRYSTTLGRLRQARRDHVRARRNKLHTGEPVGVGDDADLAELQEQTTLVVGSWRFAGIGWLTAGDAASRPRLLPAPETTSRPVRTCDLAR